MSGRRQKQTARGLSKGSPRRLAVALGEGKTQFPPADKLAGEVCERAPQQLATGKQQGARRQRVRARSPLQRRFAAALALRRLPLQRPSRPRRRRGGRPAAAATQCHVLAVLPRRRGRGLGALSRPWPPLRGRLSSGLRLALRPRPPRRYAPSARDIWARYQLGALLHADGVRSNVKMLVNFLREVNGGVSSNAAWPTQRNNCAIIRSCVAAGPFLRSAAPRFNISRLGKPTTPSPSASSPPPPRAICERMRRNSRQRGLPSSRSTAACPMLRQLPGQHPTRSSRRRPTTRICLQSEPRIPTCPSPRLSLRMPSRRRRWVSRVDRWLRKAPATRWPLGWRADWAPP